MMVNSRVRETAAHNYVDARNRFITLCTELGYGCERIYSVECGPAGERLSTDICWLGAVGAPSVLILVSGTHGVEGLAGSACQIAWLRERAELPRGVGVLVIHILNPYGCAWRRRQTEGNVDLNRNFVDFAAPLPTNDLYAQLHPHLLCPAWEGNERRAARAELERLRKTFGETAYVGALTRGQYAYSNGLGFGGTEPTWSRRVLSDLVHRFAADAHHVGIVDFHTGLGLFGVGQPIATQSGDAAHRATAWLNEPVVLARGPKRGIPYEVSGDLSSGIEQIVPNATVTGVALEFGTFDIEQMLELFIDDCWVQNFCDPRQPIFSQVRNRMQQYFYPGTKPWLTEITMRARVVIHRMLQGLADASIAA